MLIHLIHLLGREKKHVEQTLGIGANLCPFCHTVRPFKIKRIGLAEQLSTGGGKTLNHTMICAVCGARFRTDPLGYEQLEPRNSHPRDIHMLVQATRPQLWQECAERLAFENRLLSAPATLTPEERAGEMLLLFQQIDPSVENCFKRSLQFDKKSTAWLAGGVGLSIALGFVAATALDRTHWSDAVCYAAFAVFVATLLWVLALILTQRGRQLRTRLVPQLAWGLAPLHPSREELDAVLAKCKSLGMATAKKIKPLRLLAAISKTTVNTPAMTPPVLSVATPPNESTARAQKILKVFQFFNTEIEDFYTRGAHFDAPCIVSGFVTLAIGGLLVKFAIDYPWQQDALLSASGVVFFIGFIFTVWQAVLAPGRYARKQTLPKLAAALQLLAPTETEIQRALEKCKMAGYMIGKKLKPEQIMTALKALPTGKETVTPWAS